MIGHRWPAVPGILTGLAVAAMLTAVSHYVGASETASTGPDGASSRESTAFTRRFYAGFGIGASRLEPHSPIADLDVGDTRDTGFHLNLGYDFSRWLSAELYLAGLGSAGIDRRTAATDTTPAVTEQDYDAIDYQVIDLSAIVYLVNSRSGIASKRTSNGLFRREGLSLYTRLGVGWMQNDAERNRVRHDKNFSAHAAVGLGLEYGFSNGFGVRGEYIAFDSDAHYASLGLVKRFGRVVEPVREKTPAEEKPVDTLDTTPLSDDTTLQIPNTLPLSASGHFATDKFAVTRENAAELDTLAEAVRDRNSRLVISGHTDSTGSIAYNDGLALRRASAARDYLIARGIAPNRIHVESFGETSPIATNRTAEGRAMNRRFELQEE